MSRIISFFDGAQSETTPTIGNIVASSLVKYANDAAYEANEQGAPAEGNIYFNETLNLIRYYNGTSWISLVDETSVQNLENKTVDGSSTGNNTVLNKAEDVEVTPAGNLSASNAEDALNELQSDIDGHETRLDAAESDIADLQTDKENKSEKGQANGYAPLDASSLIPSIHLPSYVDDVLEFANFAAFPVTGETGKIYIDLATNFQYRWSGSIYVQMATSPVNSVNGQTGVVVLEVDDLNDVSLTSPQDNEVLTYDTGTGDWVNAPVPRSLDELSDVTLTAPSSNQILKYNGSQWVNDNQAQTLSVASKTADYTASTNDNVILYDVSSADRTLTLYTAVGNTGRTITVIKTQMLNKLTIDGNGTETIGGNPTLELYHTNDTVELISDGSNWQIKSFKLRPFICRVYKASGTQNILNGAINKIDFDTATIDEKSLFDNTNNRINIVRPGKYVINFMCQMTSGTGESRLRGELYTDTDTVFLASNFCRGNALGNDSVLVTTVANFTNTNNVSAWLGNDLGATYSVTNGTSATYFEIIEIL